MPREKWQGCDNDCFNCKYSDCKAPATIGEKKKAPVKVTVWTDEMDDVIRRHSYMTIRELAKYMRLNYATLQRHIRATKEFDDMFRGTLSDSKEKKQIISFIQNNPGCTITELSEATGKTDNAMRGMLYRMMKTENIVVEKGNRYKKMRVWIENRGTEKESNRP